MPPLADLLNSGDTIHTPTPTMLAQRNRLLTPRHRHSLAGFSPGNGPTLVVAPKGVMTNWETQIRRHIRWNHAPRMFRYHGSRCYPTARELERNDVVITTYNKVGDQLYGEGVLCKVRWRRIILDEGHNIRNPGSKAALGACKLQAQSRWVCTGTPM